ncbi:MAG: hypothetical protein LBH09_02015, partial [Peptococcaceae bacterium]|nr:hypothetical protein [Peptococcaceae bacterium]
MNNDLTAQEADALIRKAAIYPAGLDDISKALILSMYKVMQPVAVSGGDERRELWITAADTAGDGLTGLRKWYRLAATVYEGMYAVFLDGALILQIMQDKPSISGAYGQTGMPGTHDQVSTPDGMLGTYGQAELQSEIAQSEAKSILEQSEAKSILEQAEAKSILEPDSTHSPAGTYADDLSALARWLLSSAEACVAALKAGSYNAYVNENLPYGKRRGKIMREDYWRIFPEEKEAYLRDISPEEIQRFTGLVEAQPPNAPSKRTYKMTSGFFFDCCRLGYAANHYQGAEALSPKELYRAFADGRDDGLLEVEEDSIDAFDFWYNDITMRSGYPWEVCRGRAGAGISLYPVCDDYGWWLCLAGSDYTRSMETVKFYLALTDQ